MMRNNGDLSINNALNECIKIKIKWRSRVKEDRVSFLNVLLCCECCKDDLKEFCEPQNTITNIKRFHGIHAFYRKLTISVI